MNKKIKSGYYNLRDNKGIVNTYELLGNRDGYETYNYWCGAQFYVKISYVAENLARDCEDKAYVDVGFMIELATLNYDYMATSMKML